MVKRDFFKQVIVMCGKEGVCPNAEMVEIATKELVALDVKNEKAKEKRLANTVANEPIFKGILDYLANHKVALANELATACGVSTPKAVAMAKKLVADGKITEKSVKIAKVGERKAYSLVKVAEDTATDGE